jgi:DNA repair protein SbcD/Mre11
VRLVHLSDLHLGFRQFQRLTPGGINQREADIARSFRTAVDRVVSLRPDIVVIAGDVFHSVRPSNPAILYAFAEFSRLVRELPGAVIVVVAGNHDTPRSAETGCILRLFVPLGVHVVDDKARRLDFPERELSILAVPDLPGVERPAFIPQGGARFNVLLLHGEVAGVLPAAASGTDRAALEILPEDLQAPSWSYVALGHYHVYRRIAANAYYSGSVDYASTNPWGELVEERRAGLSGKGFIEHDLATGEHRFHPLPPSRALVDLEPLDGRDLDAARLDSEIRRTVESYPGGIDDKIVRLVIRNVPRHVARELDHKALREYKKRALHFLLDPRRPETTRTAASAAPGRRPTLEETVRHKLASRHLSPGVEREDLVRLGLHYLTLAESEHATEGSSLMRSEGA